MLGLVRSTAALIESTSRSAVQTLLALRRTANAMLRRVARARTTASAIQIPPK
jgi:hypothetical protein